MAVQEIKSKAMMNGCITITFRNGEKVSNIKKIKVFRYYRPTDNLIKVDGRLFCGGSKSNHPGDPDICPQLDTMNGKCILFTENFGTTNVQVRMDLELASDNRLYRCEACLNAFFIEEK